MKKRIVSIVILICMACLLLAGCQGAADGGKIANESRNGVARVVTYYTEGTVCFLNTSTGRLDSDLGNYSTSNYTVRGSGTGFGIGTPGKETDTFVTNRHVVDDTTVTGGTAWQTRWWGNTRLQPVRVTDGGERD